MAQNKRALDQIDQCFKKSMKRSAGVFQKNWPSRNWEIPESNFLLHLGYELLRRSYECYTEIQTSNNSQEHFDLVGIGHNPKWILVTEAKFVWDSDTAKKLGDNWIRMKRERVTSSVVKAASGYTCYGALLAMTSHKRIGDWWKERAESSRPAGRRKDEYWKQLAIAIRQADRVGCRGFNRASDERHMSIMYALFELRKSRR